MKTVQLPDGTTLPALGQGTYGLGERRETSDQEIASLRLGLDLGLSVIDTAEMYGEGRTESLIGKAIAALPRERVFLVSKVYPWNAEPKAMRRSCQASCDRLGVTFLDLYLLHWQGQLPLSETVRGFQELIADGLIRRWGVSNMDVDAMDWLLRLPGGDGCQIVQNLYHLKSRGADVQLRAYLNARSIPFMAYSPLAEGGSLAPDLFTHPVLCALAQSHHVTPIDIALAFVLRQNQTLAIPKASSATHVVANRKAADLILNDDDWTALDKAFPVPNAPVPLDVN